MTAALRKRFQRMEHMRLSLFEFFTFDGLLSPHPAFDDIFFLQVGLFDF